MKLRSEVPISVEAAAHERDEGKEFVGTASSGKRISAYRMPEEPRPCHGRGWPDCPPCLLPWALLRFRGADPRGSRSAWRRGLRGCPGACWLARRASVQATISLWSSSEGRRRCAGAWRLRRLRARRRGGWSPGARMTVERCSLSRNQRLMAPSKTFSPEAKAASTGRPGLLPGQRGDGVAVVQPRGEAADHGGGEAGAQPARIVFAQVEFHAVHGGFHGPRRRGCRSPRARPAFP